MTVQWTPEMDAALIDLRGRGYGYIAAGDLIGVTNVVVERRVKELGLPIWKRSGGRRQRGPRQGAAL